MNFQLKQIVKIAMQNVFLPVIYRIGTVRKVDQKLMIFADFHKDEVPYSMEDLYEWALDSDFHVVRMTKDCDSSGYISGLVYMVKFMLMYARAGYVFICDNFLPVASCKKREETVVVQMWHAGGMLKKYAYDTPRDIPKFYKGNVFRNYSLIITSDKNCNSAYISGMRADPRIVQGLGLSRTDRFYSEDYKQKCVRQFYDRYPEAKEKKIALFAPTFRGNASVPEIIDTSFLKDLEKSLGDEWILVTKMHPHLQKHIGKDACPIPTEQLLPVADVLISDYSSVIYDYLLLERPIVYYVPDLQYYIENDQFYIDYYEMPGTIVESQEDLATAIQEAQQNFDLQRLRVFKQKYMGACDGHALERLVDYLGLMQNNGNYSK
ncbi:MAG: CDP-glycerol glycerophosphotransferase family protein [Lachnospiraceae bacterium]|nr:CDP-glycerol glycerophosphotransferase family protein [Lachnospiraceae bacterium]